MQAKFTIKDFRERYPDNDSCLDELLKRKYGDNPTCPNPDCEHETTAFYRVKGRKVYECQWCGQQISPTAGTIFHKSATPLADWFYVMYLMTATRSGVSAKEVQRQLGVTYKTAWRMCNKIRQAMSEKPMLENEVEMDETYVGGRTTMKKKFDNKTPVVGAVKRGGKVTTEVTQDASATTLQRIMKTHIKAGSKIYTDEWKGYHRTRLLGYNHLSVIHSARQWADGNVNTNSIEGFWSQLKRGISGTYVSVSPQHLQKYVDEYVFRYNQRSTLTPMFDRLLQNLVRLS